MIYGSEDASRRESMDDDVFNSEGSDDGAVPYSHYYYADEDGEEIDYGSHVKIKDDEAYLEDLGIPMPSNFPSDDPAELYDDLCALFLGVMMAKGDKLDTGLTSGEFEQQLQEVTGKYGLRPGENYISLQGLVHYLELSNEETDSYNKNKGSLLLHKTFQDILFYSAASGTYKTKPLPQLTEVQNGIRVSGIAAERRREKCEKVKNDRYADPEYRKKYMAGCNLLVELILRACNRNCSEKVTYQQVQNEYKTMMTDGGDLFERYDKQLHLAKIRDDIGTQLNQASTRDLFGRGTISNVLAGELFNQKIQWENIGSGITLHLPRSEENRFYGEKDFEEIEQIIQEKKSRTEAKLKPAQSFQKPRQLTRQKKRQEQEEQELEERRKTYQPVEHKPVYVPMKIKSLFHPANNLRSHTDDEDESDDNLLPSAAPSPQRSDNQMASFFGARERPGAVDDSNSSSSDKELSSLHNVPNYTDDEEEQGVKKEPISKKLMEKKEEKMSLFDRLENIRLQKKNGSMASADKILRDKIIGFFVSADWLPQAPEATARLKDFHSELKVAQEPFEVIYVSYDRNQVDFDRYLKENHGDWSAIPFGSEKLDEMKTFLGNMAMPQLVVMRPDGTTIATDGMQAVYAARNRIACFKQWLKGSGNVSAPSRSDSRQSITRQANSVRKSSQWEMPTPNESVASSTHEHRPPRQLIASATSMILENTVNPTTISRPNTPRPSVPSRSMSSRSSYLMTPHRRLGNEQLNASRESVVDPSSMNNASCFIQYVEMHVFMHRHVQGAPNRHWSQMQKFLHSPFDMPQGFLGSNWVEILTDSVSNLTATAVPPNDILFHWVE